MRHNNKLNHLGRTSSHRNAMLANMASSLIAHKRITTTVAKAKALRIYIEPLLTKAKEDTTQSRRIVFSYLQDKIAVTELFRNVAEKIADRPGGYTRILRTGTRLGDSAEMCIIELVDFNETMLAGGEEKKGRKRRLRRGTGKKAAEPVAEVKTSKPKAARKESKEVPKPLESIAEEEVEALSPQEATEAESQEEITDENQDESSEQAGDIEDESPDQNEDKEK